MVDQRNRKTAIGLFLAHLLYTRTSETKVRDDIVSLLNNQNPLADIQQLNM